MSIGAAISITSPDAGRIIAAASLRAHECGVARRLGPPFEIVVVTRDS